MHTVHLMGIIACSRLSGINFPPTRLPFKVLWPRVYSDNVRSFPTFLQIVKIVLFTIKTDQQSWVKFQSKTILNPCDLITLLSVQFPSFGASTIEPTGLSTLESNCYSKNLNDEWMIFEPESNSNTCLYTNSWLFLKQRW